MKQDIHPQNYRPIIFEDQGSGSRFLISSTVETDQVATWDDGKEYPLYLVEISSASHPFYTGVKTTIDRANRVKKFQERAQKAGK
ncbi:50S ribosomal protein L31 [Candidatus Kaiserbacteria bacterium CG10_big_fil_rev_8_21_14_0_10_45_20]|uniref:50S ribosomal protein L31 n=1 Tax=Candidatus Kaiserbacteria bacterium CG10_big_fil_rev_8_21_14_0_10_45_20 TaxID=1974607 RepID=A0A2H0UEV4_9BACT|nr:MAG: 50S ribosomal protein L31 [Candidatus Kaiserbacteria bacterium CG10_big_fil_rev_8_21_14_0_10_45_20]